LSKKISGFIGLVIVASIVALFSPTFLHGQKAFATGSSIGSAFLYSDSSSPAYASEDALSATGFDVNETVNLFWDYQQQDQRKVGTAKADGQGRAIFYITVPSEPNLGSVNVAAVGVTSKIIATTTVIEIPALILTPSEGHLGARVNVKGGAFGRQEHISISYEGNMIDNTTTNSQGVFNTAFTLPRIVGQVTIQATGINSGASASALFSVLADLQITPNKGPSGTVIALTAQTYDSWTEVIVYWFDPSTGTKTYLTSASAIADGSLTTQITAPAGLARGKTYFVQMLDTNTSVTTEVKFSAQ
jgi:hypothetical protein